MKDISMTGITERKKDTGPVQQIRQDGNRNCHEKMEIIYIKKGAGRVTVDLESRIVTTENSNHNFVHDIKAGNRQEKLEWVKPVLLFVEEHYADRILVADAAAKVDFSEAHFMRLFKQTMGVSFVAFLKDYRLAKAEAMLRTTQESILNVAQDCGFRNFSYFIRAFKTKYGQTPLKYRDDFCTRFTV